MKSYPWLIGMCAAALIGLGLFAWMYSQRPAAPSPAPQVTVSISPNSHIVRLTVTYWSTLGDVDAVVDKFIEQHPELACSGFQVGDVEPNSGYPAKFILLCSKVGPPAEDAQDQTGPP